MRSLFFNFLSILIFSTITSAAIAQPSEDGPITTLGTISNDGDGIHVPLEFCLNSNNSLIVQTNVLLGGLTVVGTAPNQYGILPSNARPMFVEYTVNGQVLPPVEVGNFDLVTLSNGYPAFSFIAQSPAVNFSNECAETEEDYIYGDVSFRLVTPYGDGWTVYPACDYSQSWGMFSCSVYSHAPWCGAVPTYGFADVPTDPTSTCYNEWFSGGYSARLYCNCGNDEVPQDEEPHDDGGDDEIGGNNDDGDRDLKMRAKENIIINAYPNPMGQNLIVEASDDFIRTINVYNSRGELVLNNMYELDKFQNVSLNTAEFPSGLYLVRIATNAGTEIIKVLK